MKRPSLMEAIVLSLDALEFHEGCSDSYCDKCRANNERLDEALIAATELTDVDLLGKYHTWLSRNGISPETEGGWWTRAALSDKNVAAFARFPNGINRDEFDAWIEEKFGPEQTGVSPVALEWMLNAWDASAKVAAGKRGRS